MNQLRSDRWSWRVVLTALALTGCASAAPPPIHVRAGEAPNLDLGGADFPNRPIIIEVHEGDIIPLDVAVIGDLIASPAGASVPLTAKRPFFIRVDKKGLKLSLDGQDFDAKSAVPGSFALGLGLTKEGTRASLRITLPRRE